VEELKISPVQKRKLFVFKIIGGLIILVLVGFLISLYTRAFDPLWNPFRPKPEKVIEKMALEMEVLKTVHSKAKIDFEEIEDTKESFKISINFGGDSDNSDPKNPKSAGDFEAALAFEGMQFSLAGEGRVVGETSYFKLTTIPALPFLTMFGIDLSEVKDRWIKIDQESIMDWLKSIMGQIPTPGIEEMFKKQIESQKEMEEKLEKLIVGKKLYLVKEELKDEKIDKIKVYHYIVALNKEEIKKLISEIMGIYYDMTFEAMIEVIPEQFKPSPEEIEREKQEAIKDLKRNLDEFFEKIGEIEGEVWIDKKDNLLYKIKGEKEIDLSKFEEKTQGRISIKFEMDFSNFNQPVKIEAPKEYKTLEEIFGGSLIEIQARARDSRRREDLNWIRYQIETSYYTLEKYPQAKTIPTTPVPIDPGSGPCPTYQ